MRPQLFLFVLFPLTVAMACSSTAETPCMTDDDCFQGTVCLDSLCTKADNGANSTENDAGSTDDGGVSSSQSDAGPTQDTEPSVDSSAADADDENEENGPCLGSPLHCDRPQHTTFNDHYSIVADQVGGTTNESIGCSQGIDEFSPFESTTDVFSLCDGETHYYRDRLWRCDEQTYYVIFTVQPEQLCPTDLVEMTVTLLYFDGGCDNDRIECTTEDDGTRRVLTQIRSDDYHSDLIFRVQLSDVAADDIIYDYRVQLQATTTLDD